MKEFSPSWLDLREGADHRARDKELLARLGEYFKNRESISVFDLGTGTGSNLRATSPHLCKRQQWTLVDHDPELLAAARVEIAEWASAPHATASHFEISRSGRAIAVSLKTAELSRNPAPWDTPPDLVTAAALFDLVSAEWIGRFTKAVAKAKAVFYTALTHSKPAMWSPPHPADGAVTAAFEHHFGGDKGFGLSAGSHASQLLADAFSAAGYEVLRRDSSWRLGEGDRRLIVELAGGYAKAVGETGLVPREQVSAWLTARANEGTCVVGHEDLLAFPPR
ncbi:MAG TPA: SAM-dependent methyltransferase [Xanthobacteraceae bacterium]|nr:SAM-dependent methyltransferase [Xanthobacteraceae bacterium]